MKKFILLILVVISAGVTYAQIGAPVLLTPKPGQYQKAEWRIPLTATWANPYLQEDIALDMLLTSPSGKRLVLPCYYEAGESGSPSLWKARFLPQEHGKYSYQLRLTKAGKQVDISRVTYFTAVPTHGKGILHAKNNWIFQFDNGQPFRGIGENICWESRAHDDSKFFEKLHEQPKYNYEYMLRSLAKHGGNFYRTWISSFNLPIDWQNGFNSNRYTPSDNYFNPSAIAKMDRLVNLNDSLGLHMMLTLGPGAYHTREGGFSPTAADFFVNPKSRERYKNRLRYFVARWGYSPSIGAWEFFNEVDNVQFGNKNKPISADSIVQWHIEMSTYLKQLDPYHHLVTTSISHRDLKGLNSLPDIDFNQKHIYKNTAGIPAAIVSYEDRFSKPYVIGEYGYEWDWSKNFDEFSAEMDSDFKRGLWYGLFSSTPVLPMSWWWEYFDNRGTDAYIAHVRTIADQMIAAGNGNFKPVHVTTSDSVTKVYGVDCGKSTFIYIYNPESRVRTTKISVSLPHHGDFQAREYDCVTGRWSSSPDILLSKNAMSINVSDLHGRSDKIYLLRTRSKARSQ